MWRSVWVGSGAWQRTKAKRALQGAEPGTSVALLASVPLALLASLQGRGGLGVLRGKRGCHMEVTGASPSSCSSDQLRTAASELQRDARLPFSRGKTFARLCLKFIKPAPRSKLLLDFPPLRFFWGARGGESRIGAEQRPWHRLVLKGAGPWLGALLSISRSLLPPRGLDREISGRDAFLPCSQPSSSSWAAPGWTWVNYGPSLGCRGLGCAGSVFPGAGSR